MHDIKLARAIALATRADPAGIGGPRTLRLAAVLERVPERLIERLTAEEPPQGSEGVLPALRPPPGGASAKASSARGAQRG